MIPAKKAYGLYLQSRKFDIRDLDLAFYLPEEREPVHADA
jgi:hypothetical protein